MVFLRVQEALIDAHVSNLLRLLSGFLLYLDGFAFYSRHIIISIFFLGFVFLSFLFWRMLRGVVVGDHISSEMNLSNNIIISCENESQNIEKTYT